MTGTPYAYYPPEASIAPCSLCLRQHRAGSRRLLARPGSRLQFLADQFCTKGTEGSNPVSSSGESRATAQDRVLAFRAAGRGYARGDQARDRHREPSQERLKRRVAAFEDCGTLTAASASTGAINLLGGKMRRVRAVCLPASEGVGPRVRIRLAPAGESVSRPHPLSWVEKPGSPRSEMELISRTPSRLLCLRHAPFRPHRQRLSQPMTPHISSSSATGPGSLRRAPAFRPAARGRSTMRRAPHRG